MRTAATQDGCQELLQGSAPDLPFLKMMLQVLTNHGLHAYIENEFAAAIYQFPRVRLMVHRADEHPARELLHAFFGGGFLIRLADLAWSDAGQAAEN